jgi:hypothetical protein
MLAASGFTLKYFICPLDAGRHMNPVSRIGHMEECEHVHPGL